MWGRRLQWYMQAWSRRHMRWNSNRRAPGLGAIAFLLIMVMAGLALLRTIWTVFMNGFLQATPWVMGSQVSTYYWNSAGFALKSTLIIGVVLLLTTFFIGVQFSRMFKR